MKITKQQLKQIIKEELEKLYEEEKASICTQTEKMQKEYDAGHAAGEESVSGDTMPKGKSRCWQIGWNAAL